MNAILNSHKEILDECKKYGIETDIAKRWESGISHHPRSEQIGRFIGDADWLFLDDYFEFKFGGDGDNGEQLLYLLDIWFDLNNAKRESQNVK